ncbi:uncharacterized protein LOC117121552 [Anneissia japonica]|uniref:uncharacterized protein LOC117121552 n=1 Tax=Anneissia japonica TaxID=1529436 RepID=UPI0014258D1C|nr:uncharacterized protein LOC117121552 [Anneissia japonica]
MDVVSLYTSIPIQDGLLALQYFLELNHSTKYTSSVILRLAELVLTTTAFNFNGKYYRQLSGVSMGSKMAPNFACLFMGHLEHNLLQSFKGKKPDIFKRYIDDCIGITSGSLTELNDFITYAIGFHPAIKFTHEISDKLCHSSISYYPSTWTFYINLLQGHRCPHISQLSSSHPPTCKHAIIPYLQLVRLRRICSDDDDFKNKATEMKQFFNARGYPLNITDRSLEKVHQLTQKDTLQPNHNANNIERIPLVLTYHPISKKVAKIARDNFSILTEDRSNTKDIFLAPPMLAYRKDRNLSDNLVRSKLRPDTTTTNDLIGTFKCGRNRCTTCKYISCTACITGPNAEFHVEDHITCTTRNLIYCVHCIKCNMLYIGETKRRLGDRFVEHLRSIKLKTPGLPVAAHFSNNHTLSDIIVTGVKICNSSEISRKKLEERIIYKLGTLTPNGMNASFKTFR